MASNFLSPLGFTFAISRLPKVSYFVQSVTLPSLTSQPTEMPTPFSRLYFSPDHLEYSEFTVTFRVDEDMENYIELHNWMVGMAFPYSYSERQALENRTEGDSNGIYSDATVGVLNSTMNANLLFHFEDIFPTNLSEIQMDIRNTDVVYVEATATFRHKRFTIETI